MVASLRELAIFFIQFRLIYWLKASNFLIFRCASGTAKFIRATSLALARAQARALTILSGIAMTVCTECRAYNMYIYTRGCAGNTVEYRMYDVFCLTASVGKVKLRKLFVLWLRGDAKWFCAKFVVCLFFHFGNFSLYLYCGIICVKQYVVWWKRMIYFCMHMVIKELHT